MNGIIDFYETAPRDYRTSLPSGLICRAPIPFRLGTHADRLFLRYINHDDDPQSAEFQLETTDLRNYNPRNDLPFRHLKMTSDEFLLSVGYKYRPCVIVSEPIPNNHYNSPGDLGLNVIPLYGTRDDAGNYKAYIDYEMILRAQAYQLGNVFFLPELNDHDIKELFARLDRICFIRVELLQPKPVMLTERALELLREWNWRCLGFPLEGFELDPALNKFIEEASNRLDERLKG